MQTKRQRPEAAIQKAIIGELKRAGFAVWSTSQGYRAAPGGTRMTPGIPDLYCVHPGTGDVLWVEVKAPGGRLRDGQERFIRLHDATLIDVLVWHSWDDAVEYLDATGHREIRRDGAVWYPHAASGEL
jgi:hypothetical protein